MKKRLLLLLTIVPGVLLAACNNEQGQSSSSSATSASSSSTTSSTSESSSSTTSSTSESSSSSSSTSSSSASSSSASSSSSIPPRDTYTITFIDFDGSLLESKEWPINSTPSFNYNHDKSTEEWKVTFKGWSNELNGSIITIPPATNDATYYAVVEKTKQKYTITFNSNGGSLVSPITQEYNTSVSKPDDPKKDGYVFVSWCTDSTLNTPVSWPLTLLENKTLYAKWNEKVNIKSYLSALISATKQDPYSYIPEKMRSSYEGNYVTSSDVAYNFNNFTNISSIKYGGFGEQWQMVLDNIAQSEKFYAALSLSDNLISASVVAFNNWFDSNPSSTNKSIDETGYYAKVDFSSGILSYIIQLKSGFTIPLFGEVLPQIDMTYNVLTTEKSVRINLSDNNAMRYIISESQYVFGIEYGIETVSRSAYCELTKNSDESINGHIYEYITLKDKDAVKSCADFYINDSYVSVVGNKANGIIGMNGYINELYRTNEGKLLGYKVQETITKTFPVIGELTATYHTLWFNLNNISGINSVKVTEHTKDNDNDFNPNDVYVNGSSTLFKPTYNKQAVVVKTSRKYDIELRTQYRYGLVDSTLTCYETSIPMMFIQDDHDDYTNFSDFVSDIKKDNGITASVNLSSAYLTKIRNDYDNLIPIFKTNKELVDSTAIKNWIGSAVK